MTTNILIVDPHYNSIYNMNKDIDYSNESENLYERVFDDISKTTSTEHLEKILQNYPRIPIKSDNLSEIIKYNNNFYQTAIVTEEIETKYNTEIKVIYAEKINISKYLPHAIKNLNNIIEEDLNIGDKIKIRDIARETFITNLEQSAQTHYEKSRSVIECLEVEFSEYAHHLLIKWDFEFKIPKKNNPS